MVDSDDEYDRKRRDKFRGERSTGESFRTERRDDRRPMGGGGGSGARDEWAERNPFRGGAGLPSGGGIGGGGRPPRPDYRDYRGPRERYGSPGREMPPAKRMRPDWGDDIRGGVNPRFGGYDPYLMHAWNEHYAHSLHSAYAHASHPHGPREPMGGVAPHADTQTQPAMMTLKQFLETQDDGISDSEVLRKYTEYKTEFKRQQLNEFFVAHKDEEWFKHKYHPEESVKRKEEQRGFLQKRIDVFTELLDNGTIGGVKVDSVQSEALIRLLDTVVIKLEGGTDEDLKILDEKPKEVSNTFAERRSEPEKKFDNKDDDVIITSVQKSEKDDELPQVVSPGSKRQPVLSDEENWDDEIENNKPEAAPQSPTTKPQNSRKKNKKSLKRKRASSDSSASSASESDDDDDESSDEDEQDDEKLKQKYDLAGEDIESSSTTKVDKDKDIKEESASETKQEKPAAVDDSLESIGDFDDGDSRKQESDIKSEENTADGLESVSSMKEEDSLPKTEDNDETNEKQTEKEEQQSADEIKSIDNVEKSTNVEDDDDSSKAAAKAESKDDDDKVKDADTVATADKQPETIDLDKVKDVPQQPRALHRTSSIFLRNLAPAITKAEIEAICHRFTGFLRVAIADPLVERRWYRRGWITFQRDVNIKEICWNLNNQRLRDCEMGAIVNRDLSRRVRPANGITAHKSIVRADIKFCAKIAMNLDARFNLWKEKAEEQRAAAKKSATADDGDVGSDQKQQQQQQPSNGNELANDSNGTATKYSSVSDVASCYGFKTKNPVLQNITDYLIEEASAEEEELLGISGDNKDDALERDEQLISVLDRLVLYLRIVHSVDYYNHCEYPYEDEMPNRCGIIHARGPPPSKATANDLQDYIKQFESKLQQFLTKVEPLGDEEVKNLGAKDSEAEVEKFIQANTQELAKDKWLCPLSGKKFKGPEFIRKHIFNKHMEKIDEVKKEVEFFNNYLRDPKRPQLPEHPGSGGNKRTNSESGNAIGGGGGGYRPPMYPPAFAAPPYGFPPAMMMRGGGAGRGGGFNGPRRPGGHDYRPRSHYRDLDAPQEHY